MGNWKKGKTGEGEGQNSKCQIFKRCPVRAEWKAGVQGGALGLKTPESCHNRWHL